MKSNGIIWAIAAGIIVVGLIGAVIKNLRNSQGKKEAAGDDDLTWLIGKRGRVTESIIKHSYGRVGIGKTDWRAISTAEHDLYIGSEVEIVAADKAIITVAEVTKEKEKGSEAE